MRDNCLKHVNTGTLHALTDTLSTLRQLYRPRSQHRPPVSCNYHSQQLCVVSAECRECQNVDVNDRINVCRNASSDRQTNGF